MTTDCFQTKPAIKKSNEMPFTIDQNGDNMVR